MPVQIRHGLDTWMTSAYVVVPYQLLSLAFIREAFPFQPVYRIHDILVWIWIRVHGSMPLTNGSGSGFIRGLLFYVIDLQEINQEISFLNVFLLFTFWRYIYITFQRLIVQMELQNSRNQGYSYYFCLMIDGSGFRSESEARSRSTPLTNGSGSRSGRPKAKPLWIRWIRIRNTDFSTILRAFGTSEQNE